MNKISESNINYTNTPDYALMNPGVVLNVVNNALPVELETYYVAMANELGKIYCYMNRMCNNDYSELDDRKNKMHEANQNLSADQERFDKVQAEVNRLMKEISELTTNPTIDENFDAKQMRIADLLSQISNLDTKPVSSVLEYKQGMASDKFNSLQSEQEIIRTKLMNSLQKLFSNLDRVSDSDRIENSQLYESHIEKLNQEIYIKEEDKNTLIEIIDKYVKLKALIYGKIKALAINTSFLYHDNNLDPFTFYNSTVESFTNSEGYPRIIRHLEYYLKLLERINLDKILMIAKPAVAVGSKFGYDEYAYKAYSTDIVRASESLDILIQYINGLDIDKDKFEGLIGEKQYEIDDDKFTRIGDPFNVLSDFPRDIFERNTKTL